MFRCSMMQLRSLVAQVSSSWNPLHAVAGRKMAMPAKAIAAVALLCAVIPFFDFSQLDFMLLGAAVYWVVRNMSKKSESRAKQAAWPVKPPSAHSKISPSRPQAWSSAREPRPATRHETQWKQERTMMPIEAAVFTKIGWNAEVSELLEEIMPTRESDDTVQQITALVKRTIASVYPGADVVGVAVGDPRRGKAFGVAVPEVEIVLHISDEVLLAGHTQNRPKPCGAIDWTQLKKAAIRTITDRLVSKGQFKFRRSAYSGTEPKVTLMAPPLSDGVAGHAIPFDLSINAMTPSYNKALISESGRVDARAKELILLVRRWAKDRGVCFAPKGHLSPYHWTLLAIYFLQVGVADEGALLPPLAAFNLPSQLIAGRPLGAGKTWTPLEITGEKKSTATLFKEFMRFYNVHFNWDNEAISIRVGARAPPDLRLPLHALFDAKQQKHVAPTIENPFESTANLSETMSLEGLERLREEISRADAICSSSASLSELLELWAPPVTTKGEK